jgi:hypothetical protein
VISGTSSCLLVEVAIIRSYIKQELIKKNTYGGSDDNDDDDDASVS